MIIKGKSWNDMAIRREGALTEQQKEWRQKFFDAIEMWKNGEIGLRAVDELTGGGYIRHQIMMTMTHDHPMWDDVQRYFEADKRRVRGDGIQTAQGWFTREELESKGGKLVDDMDEETGEIGYYVVFPTGYLTGIDGKPDKNSPIYGAPPKKKPDEDPFARKQYRGEREWGRTPRLDNSLHHQVDSEDSDDDWTIQ